MHIFAFVFLSQYFKQLTRPVDIMRRFSKIFNFASRFVSKHILFYNEIHFYNEIKKNHLVVYMNHSHDCFENYCIVTVVPIVDVCNCCYFNCLEKCYLETKHLKTCPCNIYPLLPHFYIAKLGYAEVYLFFLFLLLNIDCGYSLEPPR